MCFTYFFGDCWSLYLQKEAITEEEQNENTPAVTSEGGVEIKEEVIAHVAVDESSEETEEVKEEIETKEYEEEEEVEDSVNHLFG